MLTRSAGVRHSGARARGPVTRMAGWRETKTLKPIDQALGRRVSESPGRNASERTGGPERPNPGGRARGFGAKAAGAVAGWLARRCGSDSTVTRTRRATGEALLVPSRNRRSQVGRITGGPGKSAEDERVEDGSVVATKRGNALERRGPAVWQRLRQHGRQGRDDNGAHQSARPEAEEFSLPGADVRALMPRFRSSSHRYCCDASRPRATPALPTCPPRRRFDLRRPTTSRPCRVFT